MNTNGVAKLSAAELDAGKQRRLKPGQILVEPGPNGNTVIHYNFEGDAQFHSNVTPANPSEPAPFVPGVTWAKDVASEHVEWFWNDYLAVGEINEVLADEGMGKSALACYLAAEATHGRLDGQKGTPTRTLFIAEEDSIEHTIKPRLQAAGADVNMIGFLRGIDHETGGFRPVMLPDDIDYVRSSMEQAGAFFLILDPTGSHIKVAKNSFDADEVRQALAPLAVAAHEGRWTVLGIRHTNRTASLDSRKRSGGSIAYRQATRVQLLFGHDPDDPANPRKRMLVGAKANLAAKAPAIQVQFQTRTVRLDDGHVEHIIGCQLGLTTQHSDTDVLKATDPELRDGRGRPAVELEHAKAYIAKFLGGDKRMKSKDFEDGAEANGISKRTLDRARSEMKVESDRDANGWYVYLPTTLE